MSKSAQVLAPVPHKLLPVVRRLIEQLDALFLECTGNAGKSALSDTYQRWLGGGRTGPSGLRHYVLALGNQLGDPILRASFTEQAERMLLNLQSGYVS